MSCSTLQSRYTRMLRVRRTLKTKSCSRLNRLGLHYDAFKLSNTDVPTEGFANIASIISANQDEEVWIESIYYRDRQHMNEVLTKIDKDERSGQMMKQSMDLLPQGAKFIVGDFERLSV